MYRRCWIVPPPKHGTKFRKARFSVMSSGPWLALCRPAPRFRSAGARGSSFDASCSSSESSRSVRTRLHFEKIDHDNYEIQSREHDPFDCTMGPPGFGQAARRPSIDLTRHDRYRCRPPHLRGLGVGKLVLPSSPTPVARACKDIVTAHGYRWRFRDLREQTVACGAAAADQWCPRRVHSSSNRSRSDVAELRRRHVANRCCYRIGTRLVDALKRVERRLRQGRFGSGNSAKLHHTFFVGNRGHRINYFL